MNTEAYELRKQMQRIKTRLVEIEREEGLDPTDPGICASGVCAQDEIVLNLKRMCETLGHPNRAVLAAWERRPGSENEQWYAMTIAPDHLPYFIRTPHNVARFLEPVSSPSAFSVLQHLYCERSGCTEKSLFEAVERVAGSEDSLGTKARGGEHVATRVATHVAAHAAVQKLVDRGFVKLKDGRYSLTMAGWETYIVITHLAYCLDLKLDTKKAIMIAGAIEELYSVSWGEPLGRSLDQVTADLSDAGLLPGLREHGIDDDDLASALREYDAPRFDI